jgi:hypothetical protein
MPTMFRQLFMAFATFFSAFQKFASALDHIGTYADESAGAFADTARIERQARLNQMLKDQKVTTKQITAATTAP